MVASRLPTSLHDAGLLACVCPSTEADVSAPYVSPRDGATAVYLRPIASHGGCASSRAHGDGTLSGSALAGQCKCIETRLVEEFGLPEAYPHTFYGKFPAKNRADCIDVMRGLSTGRLGSGLPTPFPF
jgi:hypothetical protein